MLTHKLLQPSALASSRVGVGACAWDSAFTLLAYFGEQSWPLTVIPHLVPHWSVLHTPSLPSPDACGIESKVSQLRCDCAILQIPEGQMLGSYQATLAWSWLSHELANLQKMMPLSKTGVAFVRHCWTLAFQTSRAHAFRYQQAGALWKH